MLQDKLWDNSPLPDKSDTHVGDEALLLPQAQAGDPEALGRLLSPHQRALYGLCRNMLGNAEDAEDAVQETFLRAMQSLTGFRGKAEIRTWLYRIAINVCLQERRLRVRNVPLDTVPSQALQLPSPENSAFNRTQVDAALACLLPRHRAVFLLREWEGWNVAEIAAALFCTKRRINNDLYQARRTLQAWAKQQRQKGEA